MNCRQKDGNEWDFVSGDDGDSVIEHNTANIMEAILKHNVYLHCNLHVPKSTSSVPKDISRVFELRRTLAHTEELWAHAKGAGIQNPCHSTLWLIGLKGRGTGFHVAWAEANSIAWRIDTKVCVLFSAKVPTVWTIYMIECSVYHVNYDHMWVCAWRALSIHSGFYGLVAVVLAHCMIALQLAKSMCTQ